MTTTDLVVIGGGPHGLAVLAALAAGSGPWPGSVVVVDPHHRWAQAWDDKLARLALDRLRSPQVHHPGPRPMALRDLVQRRPATEQVLLRRPEDERVPTPAGMRALIDELVGDLGPVDRIAGRAVRVTPQPGPSSATSTVLVELEDGRILNARRVVLAHNPSRPRIPEWAGPLPDATSSVPARDRGIVRHASEVDLRSEPGLGGAADARQLTLDVPTTPPPDRHVAIVGGGLTAGTLACEVIRRGGRATLLTRRPLRARPYDVDASWLGPRRLAAFDEADPSARRALIEVARDGGTMPQRVLDELRTLAETPGSGLVVREAVDVAAEIRQLLAEAGLGDDDASTPTLRPEDLAGPADVAPPIDAVWLATGFASDFHQDPLVQPLVGMLGLVVRDGLPEVTEDLRLPGTNVFVVGPYAALGVGPASRNLSGARPAAARVAATLAAD